MPMQSAIDSGLTPEQEESCIAIFRSVMHCNHALLGLGSKVAARFDLHLAEMNAIDMLGRHGPMTMGELSRITFVSPSNTTHTVKKLEEKSLVKRRRSTGSEREVTVTLTSKGDKLYRQTCPGMVQAFDTWLAERLSNTERKTLITLLGKLSSE